jgi:mono/diheme cytochrome c family protein
MKRFRWSIALAYFVILSVLFSFCTSIQELSRRPPEKTRELLNQGKKLYGENCIQCHDRTGDGQGWKAAELKKKPRNFTLPFEQWAYTKGDPKKIFEVLKKGIPDTPMAMFHFTDEQRWALVYHVMEFSHGNGH